MKPPTFSRAVLDVFLLEPDGLVEGCGTGTRLRLKKFFDFLNSRALPAGVFGPESVEGATGPRFASGGLQGGISAASHSRSDGAY